MLRFWSMVLLASLLTGCGGGGAGTSGDSGSAARASNDTVDAPDPEVQEARRIRTAGMISLPAVVVNTTTAGVQSLQGVSALPDGGYVVRWRSEGSEYLQRFDATGDWVGSEKALPFGDAVLWSDGLLQVYASNRFVSATQNSYVETSGIYLRRYDWTGSPVGAEIVVSSITENRVSQEERNLRSPVTLNLDDGGFLVAWTLTTTSYTGTVRQFWLQLYDNVGQPVGSAVNFGRGDPTENATYSLAATSDGGFVVALQKSFFAARYVVFMLSNGAQIGSFFDPKATLPHADTTLLPLSDGRFALWSTRSGSPYLQFIDAAGTPVGVAIAVTSLPDRVFALNDGGYVVLSPPSGDAPWIGQRYSSIGLAVGEPFQVDTSGAPLLQGARLDDGALVLAWNSDGADGQADVMAQLLEPADLPGKKAQLALKHACQRQAIGLTGQVRKSFMTNCLEN